MLSDDELRRMRPHMTAMVDAVQRGDMAGIQAVYRLVAVHRVEPAHALAVMLADEVQALRGRLAGEIRRGNEFAAGYMDERRRVGELRAELDRRAAAAPKRRAA